VVVVVVASPTETEEDAPLLLPNAEAQKIMCIHRRALHLVERVVVVIVDDD
jgi:hypothetical protein